MIVVEGPNGSGKTTLVRQLSKDLELQIGVRGGKDRRELWKTAREDTYNALGKSVRGKTPVVIWDRLFFSELVYSRALQRKCAFKASEVHFVHRTFEAMRNPTILCLPPWETVEENCRSACDPTNDFDLLVSKKIPEIYHAYLYSTGFTHVYDYTESAGKRYLALGSNYEAIIQVCKDYITKRAERTWI